MRTIDATPFCSLFILPPFDIDFCFRLVGLPVILLPLLLGVVGYRVTTFFFTAPLYKVRFLLSPEEPNRGESIGMVYACASPINDV